MWQSQTIVKVRQSTIISFKGDIMMHGWGVHQVKPSWNPGSVSATQTPRSLRHAPICSCPRLLQRRNILSALQNIKSLFLPSPSHPLPFTAFFPSSRPLLLLLLPTPSFSIHISGGWLYERVCVCASAPFSAGQRPTSSPSALPSPPSSG